MTDTSRVSASAELPPERSCGIEPGNPGLRPHCPRHARDRTASLELRRPSRPGASVRSVVAADVESAAHRPDRISRPIFELSHTRCRDHARQAGPQRPIAQRETAIEPDGMLDDDRWKAVTTVGYLAHPETLKHRPCRSHAVNVTMPRQPGAAHRAGWPVSRHQRRVGVRGRASGGRAPHRAWPRPLRWHPFHVREDWRG